MEYHSTCNTLPLKLFYEIIESEDVTKLIVQRSSKVTKAQLEQVWESILAQYAKLDNNVSVSEILDLNAEAFRLACEQTEVKAMLLYLVGAHSEQYVQRLQQLGYPIDVSTFANKKKSLLQCDRKASHIKTRLLLLQKQIQAYSETDNKQGGSFDTTMGWLAINLGFECSDDITVSRYLSYKSQIIQRAKSKAPASKKPAMA